MKRCAIALAILATALGASAEPIPLDAYVASLERIRASLAANDLAAARKEAKALAVREVASSAGAFHADTALLHAVGTAQRADINLQTRLSVTIDEIRRAGGVEAGAADPRLLERVAAEQEVAELAEGGEVALDADPPPLFEQILQSIADGYRWISERLGRLLDWLFDLLPRFREEDSDGRGGIRWIVAALVTMIVLLIVVLAAEVLRRSRKATAEPVAASEPVASRRDEDPLSRGATEWERYAAQLAAAGRFREAIRAWYHAVLVTSYAAGVLHFRKGRTNWEYISALGPSVPWRADFIRLTRRFEQEWYGADASTTEALDDCSGTARAIIESIRRASRGAA